MPRFVWLVELAQRARNLAGDLHLAGKRDAGIGCADCPIVMQCGREPLERCLARVEAIAAGKRRQAGLWDIGRIDGSWIGISM
jgi:hypothetical protein